MPKPADAGRRRELMTRAASVLSEEGLFEMSLRSLATELGTSARMLIYYFGSKDELVLAVLEHERRHLTPDGAEIHGVEDLREYIRRDWDVLTRGEKIGANRLLMQVYGEACAGTSKFKAFVGENVEALVAAAMPKFVAAGFSERTSRSRAMAALMALQGFVIRAYTENDLDAVDADFFAFVDDVLLAPEATGA